MMSSKANQNKPLTIGILGGGQLAKMLASAAYRLGINVSIIEKGADSPAGDMTKLDFIGGWLSDEELERFARSCDIITLENEFIDPSVLSAASKITPVFPLPETMLLVQDKLTQKQTFTQAGIPAPVFEAVDSLEQAHEFAKKSGIPFVLKARKFGYDGYGNATIFNEHEIEGAWNKFNGGETKRPLMAESFVDFKKELAVIAARSQSGETALYPCVETVQYRHICHAVIAPAEIDEKIRKKAQELALACVESIGGIGVFGVEMFLTANNEILINEIAPRPHNSGHYTIEACHTSQFENCLRAILNLPLGSPKLIAPAAAMVNLLGKRNGRGTPNSIIDALRHNNVAFHFYNKKTSRIGRKMGHVTALGVTGTDALNRAQSAADAVVW